MSETTDAAPPTEGTEAAEEVERLAEELDRMADMLAKPWSHVGEQWRKGHAPYLTSAAAALRARLTGEAQPAGDEEGWEARWRDLAERLLSRGAGQEHGPERILLMLMAQVEETIPAEPLRAAPPTAKAEAPFKLPVRVVALVMPDAWAVYDAAGNLVAETYEREHADFIAAAINADAQTAKAPSGGEGLVGYAVILNGTKVCSHDRGAAPNSSVFADYQRAKDFADFMEWEFGYDGTNTYAVCTIRAACVPTPDEPEPRMPIGWVYRDQVGTYVRDGGAMLDRMLDRGHGEWAWGDDGHIQLFLARSEPEGEATE